MKLEHPLASLAERCQTICVAECCGISAYDFSPIHIASFVTMWRGAPDAQELATLRAQLAALKANYGTSGSAGAGVTIDQMNQSFTAEAVDAFVAEIGSNLEIALELIALSESRRTQSG